MKTTILFKRLSVVAALLVLTVTLWAQNSQNLINRLIEGNKRFTTNKMLHMHQDMMTVMDLTQSQHPFATVVSCSDSRVSPEIVFDQGLGDIFSIRTAGNVMSDYEEGSIEYAAEHLNTKLVVVMGHEGCGAVKAFLDYAEENAKNKNATNDNDVDPEHEEIVNHIMKIVEKMASEEEEKSVLESPGEHYSKAVRANVINGVKQLRNSYPILAEMYKKGDIHIVGAIYHIDNGQVEFLDF